jgi:hypothetical protein
MREQSYAVLQIAVGQGDRDRNVEIVLVILPRLLLKLRILRQELLVEVIRPFFSLNDAARTK